MNLETIEQRIENAQAKLNAKIDLLNRLEQRDKKNGQKVIARKARFEKEFGVPFDDIYSYLWKYEKEHGEPHPLSSDFSDFCLLDWSSYQNNLKREDTLRNETIPELQSKLDSLYETERQIKAQISRREFRIAEIPACLKEYKDSIEKEYYDFYREALDVFEEEDGEHDRDFYIRHPMFPTFIIGLDDEGIRKLAKEDADNLVLDLIDRTETKVGNITDLKDFHLTDGNNGTVINGVVIGDKGKAEVKSIFAGGYNIQRLHARTLVTPIH